MNGQHDTGLRIGLIADTHGLLRPAALAALQGSTHIVHAGDIGNAAILAALGAIAPVTAVRGNNDRDPWAAALHDDEVLVLGTRLLYVLHDRAALDLDPAAAGFQFVITGHSHRPAHEQRDGVHYINPGSAGPRRFSLPVTLASLSIDGDEVAVRFVDLGTTGA